MPRTVGLDRSCLAPHALARWAARHPDRVAVEHADGARLTFAELHTESLRWAGAYRRLGVDTGDHVATMLPNGFTNYCAWFGLSWLRAVEVPLNNAFTGRMLQYTLDNSDSTTLVIASDYVEQLAAVANELPTLRTVIVVGDPPSGLATPFRVVPAGELLDGSEPADDVEGPEYRDIVAILYTSGTTGPSKGVLVPWANVYQMWSWVPSDAIAPGDGLYCAFPMFHNSGKSAINASLVRGARFVMRERFSATHFWDDVRRTRCRVATIVGPMTAFLYAQSPRPDDADNPLESVLCGPMIPEIEDFERRFGVRVGTCYGMTEIGSPVATGWDHGPWATCGRERQDYPWTEVRVVDEHDEPVGPGVTGELAVRTAEPWALNAGYYKMPEKTAEAWGNGWFHTGDAFRYDEDGWYYFVDRLKDSIRRRGENISSFEVEAIVSEHPGVYECAAVGVPAEHGEDEVMIVVVPQDRATLDAAALRAWLEPRLPKFMLPRYVDVVDDLPRNETSLRVRKNELRARGVTPTTWDAEAS